MRISESVRIRGRLRTRARSASPVLEQRRLVVDGIVRGVQRLLRHVCAVVEDQLAPGVLGILRVGRVELQLAVEGVKTVVVTSGAIDLEWSVLANACLGWGSRRGYD